MGQTGLDGRVSFVKKQKLFVRGSCGELWLQVEGLSKSRPPTHTLGVHTTGHIDPV